MSIVKEARAVRAKASATLRQRTGVLLEDYRTLARYLTNNESSENTMLLLISVELTLGQRPSILLRLHQRLCRLRRDREREELLGG